MARACILCHDTRLERVDGLLRSGLTVAQVWDTHVQKWGVCSLAALYRHARHAANAGPLSSLDVPNVADSITRVAAVARLQGEIAANAAARGAEATAIRASSEERRSRLDLLDLLGADADDIAAELASFRAAFNGIRKAIRSAPEAAAEWADAIDDAGHNDLAADVRLAAAAAITPKEN